MLKTLLSFLLPLLRAWGVESLCNPYVVEWVLHYIKGSKVTKRLPDALMPLTRAHILADLCQYAAFSPSTGWGHANWRPYKGSMCWYSHPTMGVVGGFIYKLVSYEDKFIVKCLDTWDFNNGVQVPVNFPPGVDEKVIKKVIKRLGLPLAYSEETGRYGVPESALCVFNEAHSFNTEWEVTLPEGMKCSINSPLKEKWAKEQRRKKGHKTFRHM